MSSRDPRQLSSRRVRHLHVRAGNDEDASRATTLLADALRTASLPGADDGRLVVIRRLALGRISAGVGSPTLALQIERATSAILSSAVVHDDRSAESAEAVTFPSRAAAIITLARHHARGAAASEWFWPMVVSGWAAASRRQRWLLLLGAAHQLPAALPAAAAILDEAFREGVEDELVSSIPRHWGQPWPGVDQTSESIEETWQLQPFSGRHRECLRRWLQAWSATDDRLLWLGTIVTVREHPAMIASPRLRGLVARRLQHLAASEPMSDRRGVSAPRRHLSDLPVADPMALATPARLAPVAEKTGGPRPERDSAIPISDRAIGAHSLHAGLYFLIPVLERLGFSYFVDARPQLLATSFPSQLLSFIGQRVGLTADDPMAESLVWLDSDVPVLPRFTFDDLPDRARDVLTAPPPRVVLDSAFVAWLTAVRRWCRREARIGLTSLVRRPGRIVTSSTHVDVSFPLSRADIRLRRLALDIDPGWVPWLGCAISFHYVHDAAR